MMILPYEKMSDLFAGYDLGLTEKQYSDFDAYASLLVEWNGKMNLTAITDAEGISIRHFLDSALIFRYADIGSEDRVIDVGTGAGFPGIPMKIYRNSLDVTLLDSLNKRVSFLREVSDKLVLPMECVHSRAEEGGRKPELREKFNTVAARAVAALPVLCEYCLPYAAVGGRFIAMKGPNEDYKAAFTAYRTLGGELESVEEYELPDGEKRRLIIIRKIKPTPEKYPRNPGQISKKNL